MVLLPISHCVDIFPYNDFWYDYFSLCWLVFRMMISNKIVSQSMKFLHSITFFNIWLSQEMITLATENNNSYLSYFMETPCQHSTCVLQFIACSYIPWCFHSTSWYMHANVKLTYVPNLFCHSTFGMCYFIFFYVLPINAAQVLIIFNNTKPNKSGTEF